MAAMVQQFVLGIEGGATTTQWVYLKNENGNATVLQQGQLPAANFALISERDLGEHLNLLPKEVTHLGLYFPGVLSSDDHRRLRALASVIWPSAKVATGSDRDSGFAAAFGNNPGINVISGTGSAVTGRKGVNVARAGGKGHLIGDKGSAYHVAIKSLRLLMDRYDEEEKPGKLGSAILREICANRIEDVIGWVHQADKSSVARLATVVFAVYKEDPNDEQILNIFRTGAEALARSTALVVKKLDLIEPAVALRGSMFVKQELYVQLFTKALWKRFPNAKVSVCTTSGAMGAALLASESDIRADDDIAYDKTPKKLFDMMNALTEQRNEKSLAMDRMTSMELVGMFVEEEKYVYEAVKSCQLQLCEVIETVASALRNGGRLFYVGAGTSGRLGMLDASEIPPTFGEPSTTVQGIIAGGLTALYQSVEGAEDDPLMGASAILERGVTSIDVVCGITASGRTPFVIGSLRKAKEIGAATVFVTSNPNHQWQHAFSIDVVLATGPELVTGSTRLKAGTATKVALNIITTGAMVLLGKVQSNLMVSLKASNVKLQDRAARLVSQLRKCSYKEAFQMLQACNWNIMELIK